MFDCRVCEIHIRDTATNNSAIISAVAGRLQFIRSSAPVNIESPDLNGKLGGGGPLQAPINKTRSSSAEQFEKTNKVPAGQYSAMA